MSPPVYENEPAPAVYYAASQSGSRMPFAKVHYVFGIIHMIVGGLCFQFDVVTIFLNDTTKTLYKAGIYAGIFFWIVGLLGFFAGRNQSKCCVFSCLIMNINACFVATFAIEYCKKELESKSVQYKYGKALNIKAGCVLGGCVFEFVLNIIHLNFCFMSFCSCCKPRPKIHEQQMYEESNVNANPTNTTTAATTTTTATADPTKSVTNTSKPTADTTKPTIKEIQASQQPIQASQQQIQASQQEIQASQQQIQASQQQIRSD